MISVGIGFLTSSFFYRAVYEMSRQLFIEISPTTFYKKYQYKKRDFKKLRSCMENINSGHIG